MSELGFNWNVLKTVQKQSPERVITNERMSSKDVVQNPNRISLEQIVAALCVCVGELVEIQEAQAKRILALQTQIAQGGTNGKRNTRPTDTDVDAEEPAPEPKRTRTRPRDATT